MVLKGEKKKSYNAKHYLKNKHKIDNEKKRNYMLKNRYGIDLNEYNLLLKSQDYKCAICGSKETGRSGTKYFSVDHCHETNRIRGLLCNQCNTAIGSLKDDPDIVYKAWMYLCFDQGRVDEIEIVNTP